MLTNNSTQFYNFVETPKKNSKQFLSEIELNIELDRENQKKKGAAERFKNIRQTCDSENSLDFFITRRINFEGIDREKNVLEFLKKRDLKNNYQDFHRANYINGPIKKIKPNFN